MKEERKEEKIYITREEIEEECGSIDDTIDDYYSLLNRSNKYSVWATNISIANLGFFLAVLLRLKSQNELYGKMLIATILTSLSLCIIIGFYIRIRFEIIESYRSIIKLLNKFMKYFNTITSIFKEKGEDVTDLNEVLKPFMTEIRKKSKIESMSKTYPKKLMITQVILLLYSIFQISYYVLNYIFFRP